MQRDQIRQIVATQVYQSLADSKIQLTAIPQDQLQALVNSLADGFFAAFAAVEEAGIAPPPAMSMAPRPAAAPQPQAPHAEELLWRGRPYLTIGTIYELTNQRLRIITGILGNHVEELELLRVHDTKVKQHLGERALNVGDITIFADDSSTPTVVLSNVTDPMEVREMIRKAVLEERQRRGVAYREVMR
jgi:Bacterial PH domain